MNIRVLIVDDSEDDALLILRNLKQQGYITTFERVDTAGGLKSALDRGKWDVVLTDYSMPHFSGLSALSLIRTQDTNIPIIVISGVVGEDTAVDMMRAGANDYIMKSNLRRLAPAIEREMAEADVRLQKHQADITIAQQGIFLSTVMDSLDHPFYVIDANDYTVKLANKAIKESCAWKDRIMCYELTHNRQSPCDCQQHPCPLKEVVSTGKSITVEHTHYDKDGKERYMEVHAHPIFDSNGNVVQIIEYCLDITERKQAENKLIDHQKQLKSLAWQLSLAEELERRRIATGIHDDVTQSLIAVKMRLAELDDSIKAGQVTEDMDGFKEYIGELIEKTRLLAFDLSSPVLYEVGLEAAIKGYLTKEIIHKHEIKAEFKDDGLSKLLDEDVQIQLFRSVRELLTNVIKHAHAQQIIISIYKEDDTVKIFVKDDGVGCKSGENDSASDMTKGFGLFSIRENLSQLGGIVEVDSKAGQGTTVILTAPLRSKVGSR